MTGVPLSPGRLTYGFSDGRAERDEAVPDGNTDLEIGELTVEVASGQTLARQFDTLHPFAGKTIRMPFDPPDQMAFAQTRTVFWPGSNLDAASAVVTAPSSPDGPTEAP